MFLAVAGAVIGGTSLFGGQGSVIGAFIGVAVLVILRTGLQHHRRQRLHVRPDHRDRDHRVDGRQRAGGAPPEPREAAVSADGAAIRVESLAKSFGAVTALVDVSLRLRAGGVSRPDRGQRGGQVDADQDPERLPPARQRADLRPRRRGEPPLGRPRPLARDRHRLPGPGADPDPLGRAQHVPQSRADRGVGPFRWLANGEMRRRARSYIDDIGIKTLRSVRSEVAMLSGGQRQAIAIARSVTPGARILSSTSRSRRWARRRAR